ncbi:MAG: 16S rRNA (adenine(1518)-N(6)/adenine(1519)-N(6))-dimethyltransferase RsmA [Alphaproteobacteria bacterium]
MAEADAAASLPPLREVIARHRLSTRKSLGQNFLLDPRLIDRIARAAGDLGGMSVIEVGPGPGGLTRALLAGPAREVVAVEHDARCIQALAELAAVYPGRLRVVEGDALEIDTAGLVPPPRAVVANLPYNVATPLLFRWLEDASAFVSLTLMFQKEVAQRITAAPGGRDYGRLSIFAQWLCEVRRLFDVLPGAFVPPPKVTSTLVRLVPRPRPLAAAEPAALKRVAAAAFGQRRKMLRSSLKSLGVDTGRLLADAGVPPTARAEEIDVAGFRALARACVALEANTDNACG